MGFRGGKLKVALYILLLSSFLSGVSALIAEFSWLRMLTPALGGSSRALNIMLVTFMGGLALGSYVVRKIPNIPRKYLYWYVAAEGFLAVYISFSPSLIRFLNAQTSFFFSNMAFESLFMNAFRLTVSAIAILPATVAMGLTTPILISLTEDKDPNKGYRAGIFYGINTFGGMCGVILSSWYLILEFGLSRTLQIAGLLNATAALVVFLLIKGRRDRFQTEAASVSQSGNSKTMLPVIAFCTGFAAMAFEVIFLRFLLFSVGVSYFSHSIIIIFGFPSLE